MTLNCIHIFIITGSFFVLMCHEAGQSAFFIYSCIYLQILIISYLATYLGTNSLSVLMCCKAVNQSISLFEERKAGNPVHAQNPITSSKSSLRLHLQPCLQFRQDVKLHPHRVMSWA